MIANGGSSGRPAIFVIDDDHDVARSVVFLLKTQGYNATGFPSAEAFLAHDLQENWRCGLVDVQMPGMDGLSLAELMHSNGAPPPFLLIITGRMTDDVERRAMAAGVLHVLAKPLNAADVLDAVRVALAA